MIAMEKWRTTQEEEGTTIEIHFISLCFTSQPFFVLFFSYSFFLSFNFIEQDSIEMTFT